MATYTLPDLPYDYAALEPHISGEIIELHHDKHHAAYVKGANDTLDKLAEARDKGDFGAIVGLEKTLRLPPVRPHPAHALLAEPVRRRRRQARRRPRRPPSTPTSAASTASRRQLTQATATTQGSGWGVLSYDSLGKKLTVQQVEDHQGNVGIGNTPLLVFDAWEHAFYLQYKNVKPDYVNALWNIVNWADVAARYDAVSTAALKV